jgi:tetratricopeptide (TPR) repeat protein
MFEFGRELKRMFGLGASRGRCDPSFLELVELKLLALHGRSSEIAAGRVSAREPICQYLDAAMIWREHARRSGDLASLLRSAKAVEAAEREASGDSELACVQLEGGLTSLTGADLFGDPDLVESARRRLAAAAALDGDAAHEARLQATWARLASREALAANDYDRALEAAALFDQAVHALDALSTSPVARCMRLEAAERAELLAGFGQSRREPRLLEGAIRDLQQLRDRLDPDYEPLTAGRVGEILGACLTASGEITGRVEQIAEGVSLLAELAERFPREHSPLDWARQRHALALGLQALGECCDSEEAYMQAERVLEDAWAAACDTPTVVRATIANNRAACVARRAERLGDLKALGRAETAFKAELCLTRPEADPVSWAVLQVNLARVYEAKAELEGGFATREAAVYAYGSAFDVFSEHGMRTLSASAAAGLERVRAAA